VFHLTLAGDVQLDRLAIGVPFKDKFSASNEGRIPRADGRVDRLTP
jgi:hypothetical protein